MRLKGNRTFYGLAAILVFTLAAAVFTLAPATADAGCTGFVPCSPGDISITNTGNCCNGKEIRTIRYGTSNCEWGSPSFYDCGGPSCSGGISG